MRRWILTAAVAGALVFAAGCTDDSPARPSDAGTPPPRPSVSDPPADSFRVFPPSGPPATASGDCRPTRGSDHDQAAAPDGTAPRARLGPGRDVDATAATIAISRRGEPLVLTGVVYAPDCRTPLAGATVTAWHTDAAGHYGPSSACCYLTGMVRTDSAGRYTFDTIVPGRYAEANPPPRHIHLAVGHPQARNLFTELVFAGDPGVAAGDPLAVTPTTAGDVRRITFDIVLPPR